MSARSDDVEDEDDWGPPQIFVDGVVRVCEELCSTCIFRRGNLMHLQPGRVEQMVRSSLDTDTAITCHKTLELDKQAICRGFYNRYWRRNWLLREANRMKIIKEVEVG